MSDLVSILIPAYNAEPYLAQTLQSCLNQTWPRLEIIVVDDGSRDGTLAVARRFESGNVKVVTQPNGGAPVARNRAYELAQGAYVQWLDADDLLDPRKVAAQIHAAKRIGDPFCLLSGAYGTFYHRPEKAVFVRTSLWRDLTPIDYFLTRFNENLCFQTDAWLVSRELSEAAGPWSDLDSPDDDGEYFCRVAAQATGIKFVESARSYYRVGVNGSLHISRSNKALGALYESKVKCIKYLLAMEDSPRTRAASVRLLQDWLPNFYPEQREIVANAQALARELGGELLTPQLKWKYRPVELLFGYPAAARFSRTLPAVRTRLATAWDGFVHRLSNTGVNRTMNIGQTSATKPLGSNTIQS